MARIPLSHKGVSPSPTTYRRPRGTQDVLPEEAARWRGLESLIDRHSRSFGFGELRTPVFEETDLFVRTAGASSDIVRKEMYTFRDLGGRSLTLRPEGTAGAGRAYLENGLASAPQPVKLWYVGPMFRYDRPQAGRFRQHTQYGIEIFGAASPLADLEVILVAHDLFRRLGLSRLTVQVNNIGCPVCRPAFREQLVNYFASHLGEMCADCRERFERNPLRIFDCKGEDCRRLLGRAPVSVENLCEDCRVHHDRVKGGLSALRVTWAEAPLLVRGLDYYTRTVFEIIHSPPAAEGEAGESPAGGAHNVICGGGRYDGLIEELGGQPTPGVGFGLGLERLLAVLESQGLAVPAPPQPAPDGVFVAAVGTSSAAVAFQCARDLRQAGRVAINDLGERSLKAQLKAADRAGLRWFVLIGEDETARGVVGLRDLAQGTQSEVPAGRLSEVLSSGD